MPRVACQARVNRHLPGQLQDIFSSRTLYQKTAAVSGAEWSSPHAKSPVQRGFSVAKDIHCKGLLVTTAVAF